MIKDKLKKYLTKQLNKFSYFHIEDFTSPYIIKKHTEGVDFLFAIKDSHARLWYDLYSTDPVWVEMKFIKNNLVNPGDIVIECGSHHGCTAILLSNWVGPMGKVYAYEPGINNYEILRENIALNKITNINPLNEVVGNENGFVNFTEFSSSSIGSKVFSEADKYNNKMTNTYSIKQVTLDKYLPVKPALIKIDTQGYVYQTLLGAKHIIEEQKLNLALEIDSKNAINKYGEILKKCLQLLITLNTCIIYS